MGCRFRDPCPPATHEFADQYRAPPPAHLATGSWPGGKFGFRRNPTVAACGTKSRTNPSRFGSIVAVKRSIPVTVPPRWLRPATRPRSTGSAGNVETDWIVAVARSGEHTAELQSH